MSVRWTLTYASQTKTFAEWKLSRPRRKRISQGISYVTFSSRAELYDADTQFAQGAEIKIHRVTTDISGNETSVQWFVGRVEEPSRFGSPQGEGISYVLVDAVYYLAETIYQIYWKEHSVPGDPSSPLVNKYLSEIFLNKSITDAVFSTRQQMADALNYCLETLALAENGGIVPFQFNATEFPAMNIPIDQVVDAPCLAVIIKQLRFMPDAVLWVDYETTPPTIHIQRRSALTPVTINVAGKPTEGIQITPRYDLQRPAVAINFKTINNNNGTPLREVQTQIAPEGATGREFRAVIATVNLEGYSVSVGSAATIERFGIAAKALNQEQRHGWWKLKVPWLADARITNLEINFLDVVRETNYEWELVNGQIPPGSGFNAVRETIRCQAKFNVVESGVTIATDRREIITVQLTATDATTNTIASGASGSLGEPIPANLAANLFAGCSFLPWEGTLVFAERELTSPVGIGNVLNLSGGLAEWETMNAVVQQVDEDMETGKTTVTFGPPAHLGIPDLVELLRFNSQRLVLGSNASRISGVSGGASGTVNLGRQTAIESVNNETMRVTGVKYFDPSTPASIINLDPTLAGGRELKPISMTVCVNNVQKQLRLIGWLEP